MLPFTPKVIVIFFIFGGLLLLDRWYADGLQPPPFPPIFTEQNRHQESMSDWGRNDTVHVRSPWGNER